MRATLWAAALAAGCGMRGNADVVTEDRTVPGFTGVSSNNAVEVGITIDSEQTGDVTLQVEAESNLIGQIATEVRDDVLEVDIVDNVAATRPMRVTGSVDDLGRADANNAAKVTVTGLATSAVVLSANNAGRLELTGTAGVIDLEVDNGGIVEASDLEAGTATVDLNNGGSAALCVTDTVTGSVANGATLTVRCGGDTSAVETRNGGSVGRP